MADPVSRSRCRLPAFWIALAATKPAIRFASAGSGGKAGSSSGSVGSLDPHLYNEPSDLQYWGSEGCNEPPCPVDRFKSAELTREVFERKVQDGHVFVVEDIGQEWPMSGWDCDYFRSDPTFSQAEMNQQYTSGGGSPFVSFKSDWLAAKTKSGAKDDKAPQVAPFYWGIKDVQHADAHRSKTWRKAMLKKVQEHIRLPTFMDKKNVDDFRSTPEFWFAGQGAGAKAHMDSHVQATMSIQLAGTKRWRLRMMDQRLAPFLAMTYSDGDVYERGEPWKPQFELVLKQGEALFFPPGFIHETLNLDEGEGSCAASVTFQFKHPFAVRMYRRFFPRIRRTADIHEAWPLIAAWASLHGKPSKSGMSYEDAKAEASGDNGVGAIFRKLDKNADGALTLQEFRSKFKHDAFEGNEASNILAFHDLDQDGRVSHEEFAEVFAFWAGVTQAAVDDTPKAYRKYQLKDMQGGFNIEDLPSALTKKMLKSSRKLEESRRQGNAAGQSSAASEL